jgi:hypothetical protein
MSRSMSTIMSVVLLAAASGVAVAQDDSATVPMWSATTKSGAADVTAFGDGYVLVGGAGQKEQARAWSSADGRTWARAKKDPVFKGAAMSKVAAFDGGVAALGSMGRKLLAWSSADGRSWQRKTIGHAGKGMSLFPAALTDGPAGLLAAAHLVGQDLAGQSMYLSSDGRSWQKIEPPLPSSEGMVVALTADADEYLAVARSTSGTTSDLYFRSADGRSWTPFAGPENGALYDLAVGADGTYAAVGRLAEGDAGRSAIWHASELGTWQLVHSSASTKETEERLDVIDAAGPGFIASGITSGCPDQPRSCPTAAILESADGIVWASLGVADGVPGPLHDTAVVAAATNGADTVLLAWHDARPAEVWTQPGVE